MTVLGDHLQSEKTRDWTFVCHGHPPKKMTCCLPPVKLTRDKTVHSAPRTQKSLSIDKERVTRSRGQTKYPTNHGALWYNEETLRKKTLKLYTFTHGFVGFKPSNSLPPTVFYSNPAAASIPPHSLDATVLYKQRSQFLERCDPQSWDWQRHNPSSLVLMGHGTSKFVEGIMTVPAKTKCIP